MTVAPATGAPGSRVQSWSAIDWRAAERQVQRLGERIAKATREGKSGKVRALQRLMTTSFHARALAVRQVTSNQGRNTPGIDGVVYRNGRQKFEAILMLKRRGYSPQPLRRVYIPKRNGQRRPLGIPTMRDRAMQALHRLALEPVAETRADPNSYGFRKARSVADAMAQCFITLAKRVSPAWVLDADVKACFDRIDHDWLLAHVPMDKTMLHKWLTSGVLEDGDFRPTPAGTPQGGVISPTLMNLTLDGLEAAVKAAVPARGAKVNVIRYADDFVITGASESLLRETVMPAVKAFLAERGLELSADKTRVLPVDQGFDFLGFNVRKYNGKLLIQRAKEDVRTFLRAIKDWVMDNIHCPLVDFVRQLSRKLRGWAQQCRHAVVKHTFATIDERIYQILHLWARKRHRNQTRRWRFHRYWRHHRGRWRFCAAHDGQILEVFKLSEMPVRRHVKITANCNPYDPVWRPYLARRSRRRQTLRKLDARILTRPAGAVLDPQWIPSA